MQEIHMLSQGKLEKGATLSILTDASVCINQPHSLYLYMYRQ